MSMPKDNSSRTLKKHGIKPLALPARRVGDWEKARQDRKHTPGAPKVRDKQKHKQVSQLTEDELEAMAHKKAGGMSYGQIAGEHGVATKYVRRALTGKFIHTAKGREILKGVLLDGAIAAGVQTHEKMGELNGMQSAIVTGVFTQRFIDMDKHTATMPHDQADFAAIAKASDAIEELVRDLGVGDVIDVDAEVTREES